VVRSFTYTPLAELTLEWVTRATCSKSKNAAFEPLLLVALDALLAQDLPQAVREDGEQLRRLWDTARDATQTARDILQADKLPGMKAPEA